MERIPHGVYTPEFWSEAVKLVEKEGVSVDQAAKRLLVPKSSLGNWLRASRSGRLAKVGQGQQVPTEMELARLRKELAEKVGARPAKKVCCVFCEGVAVKYERIEQLRHQYPTAVLCRVMDISESGYHAWWKRPPSARQQESVRLESEIRAAHQRTRVIDLDRFKMINDTLGHAVGDGLLIEVAKRLQAAIRESDLVARLGGDEFVVVLRLGEGQAVDYSAMVADKILSSVAQPYSVDGHPLGTTPSVGIALYPRDGDDMNTLMKCADIAMYRAKEAGRGRFCYFAGAATPLG